MRRITIISKKHGTFYALIDDADFDIVSKYTWNLKRAKNNGVYYACSDVSPSRSNRKTISMHRLVMAAKKGQVIDHINHNTLDNQKNNLRVASESQSCSNRKKFKNNTTGFKGVILVNYKCGKYKAKIGLNKEKISIGYFDNVIDAAIAYNAAAIKYFGKFAQLNIIPNARRKQKSESGR